LTAVVSGLGAGGGGAGYGYHCVIQVASGQTLSSSGSATLNITATNGNGTSSPVSVPVSWTFLGSTVPVVSEGIFSVTTPATGGATVGSVAVTNSPTKCYISGDPGSPINYFTIAPDSNNTHCVIKVNSTSGNATLNSGSYGSPLLYVTACNGACDTANTSLGSYVVVSLGLKPRKRRDYWNFWLSPLPPDRALGGTTALVRPLPWAWSAQYGIERAHDRDADPRAACRAYR
jgi:hypothetical protein